MPTTRHASAGILSDANAVKREEIVQLLTKAYWMEMETVISYLSMVRHCLEALEQVPEVSADLIDLRWLDRASVDWDTITASVRKTNRVLIVEQGAVGTSYGGWLSDEIQRRLFDWLDAPVTRVTGSTASPSISKVLERAAIARTEEVVEALRRLPNF